MNHVLECIARYQPLVPPLPSAYPQPLLADEAPRRASPHKVNVLLRRDDDDNGQPARLRFVSDLNPSPRHQPGAHS